MSTIPTSAMPHATDAASTEDIKIGETNADDAVAAAKAALGGLIKGVEDFAREVGDRVKADPKRAAITAGAVVVGGIVAAAAVPLVRAARKPSAKAKTPAKPKAPAKRAPAARKPATSRARKPKASAPS